MNPILLVALALQVRVLTLDQVVSEAETRQPQLAQARAQMEAARARVDLAEAGLLPSFDSSASYSLGTSNSPGTDDKSFDLSDSFNFRVSGGILLWDFNQTSRRRDAAEATAEAQGHNARNTRAQVLLDVRLAFFTARAAKDLVKVAEETLANQEKHQKQIGAFVRVGTRPEIDMAQARTDVSNARVQLIRAQNTLGVAKARLIQAVGLEAIADEIDVGDDTLPAVPGEEGALLPLVDEAARARPEIAALDAQIRAQEISLSATERGLWPELRANVGASEGGPGLTDMAWNLSGSLTLSWQIWDGGANSARAHEANASLAGLRAQREGLRQNLRLDVEQAHRQVRSAQAERLASEEALVNARERLRLAEGRYENGVGNVIELGDAQVTLTSTAAQRVQAEYNLASARAQLIKALGR